GISLHGPGILYNLRFRASNAPQTTEVHIRSVEFYNAGFFARPVAITNSTTHIGPPTDARSVPGPTTLRLEAAPNPFNPSTVLHIEVGSPGPQSLVVRDTAGRTVRWLERGWFA